MSQRAALCISCQLTAAACTQALALVLAPTLPPEACQPPWAATQAASQPRRLSYSGLLLPRLLSLFPLPVLWHAAPRCLHTVSGLFPVRAPQTATSLPLYLSPSSLVVHTPFPSRSLIQLAAPLLSLPLRHCAAVGVVTALLTSNAGQPRRRSIRKGGPRQRGPAGGSPAAARCKRDAANLQVPSAAAAGAWPAPGVRRRLA